MKKLTVIIISWLASAMFFVLFLLDIYSGLKFKTHLTISIVCFVIGLVSFISAKRAADDAKKAGRERAEALSRQLQAEQMKEEMDQKESAEKARAEEERKAEAKKAREEFLSKHGIIKFTLSATTRNNDDGTSRQSILKAIGNDPNPDGDLFFDSFEHNGKMVLGAFYDGECIGIVPRDTADEVLSVLRKIECRDILVEKVESDLGEKVYSAEIIIQYSKEYSDGNS